MNAQTSAKYDPYDPTFPEKLDMITVPSSFSCNSTPRFDAEQCSTPLLLLLQNEIVGQLEMHNGFGRDVDIPIAG